MGDKLSRRDFLKVGGAAIAATALTAIGGREALRFIFEKENSIDLSIFTLPIPGRDEKMLNYSLLKVVYPELIKEEDEGYSFVNPDNEKPIVLNFGNLGGEKIRLHSTKVDVAVHNVSWEDALKDENTQSLTAGLVLRGSFDIKGSVADNPIFIGDVLHRTICFIGDGDSKCSVSDISLSGLKSFNQNENPDLQATSPSYISADNADLTVEGVKINHDVSRPEEINESNAQLTKGICVCNTTNKKALQLSIHTTRIDGLEWDGIYSNGKVNIDINKSVLVQDKNYKHVRGAAVGSTFNSQDGYARVRNTKVDYSKGVGIWTNQGDESDNINLIFDGCEASVACWYFNMDVGQ